MDELFAALPALDAGEQPAGPGRYRRIELDFPEGTAWFEDPFSEDAFGVEVGEGPCTVYLLLDGEERADVVPEVSAALVRFGDALPVETGWEGEGLMTDSGFLVVRGGGMDTGVDGVLPAAGRALAALKRRPPVKDGHWDRAADLEQALADAGVEAEALTAADADAEPGDYAEGWLVASARPALLGCFVDPDGYQLLPCLDAEGNEVGVLLCGGNTAF
ncbi:hypothetical protein ACPC54_11175 [Kitasatospora sp. NPDC094028]